MYKSYITTNGLNAMSNLSGTTVTLSKIAVSDKAVNEAQIHKQTALANEKSNLAIVSTNTIGNVFNVVGRIESMNITTGFNIKQLGLFLNINGEEVLFQISQVDEGEGDYIPSKTENPDFFAEYSFSVALVNDNKVECTVDITQYTKKGEVAEQFETLKNGLKNGELNVKASSIDGIGLKNLVQIKNFSSLKDVFNTFGFQGAFRIGTYLGTILDSGAFAKRINDKTYTFRGRTAIYSNGGYNYIANGEKKDRGNEYITFKVKESSYIKSIQVQSIYSIMSDYNKTWNFDNDDEFGYANGGTGIFLYQDIQRTFSQGLVIDARNGKFDNTNRKGNFAQINAGTIIKIPVPDGKHRVTIVGYNGLKLDISDWYEVINEMTFTGTELSNTVTNTFDYANLYEYNEYKMQDLATKSELNSFFPLEGGTIEGDTNIVGGLSVRDDEEHINITPTLINGGNGNASLDNFHSANIQVVNADEVNTDNINANTITENGEDLSDKYLSVKGGTVRRLTVGNEDSINLTGVDITGNSDAVIRNFNKIEAMDIKGDYIYEKGVELENKYAIKNEIGTNPNLLIGTKTQDIKKGNLIKTAIKTDEIFKGCYVFKSSANHSRIGFNITAQNLNRNLFKVGDWVTYSIYVKTDNINKNRNILINVSGDNIFPISRSVKNILSANWEQISYSFQITNEMLTVNGLAFRFEDNADCEAGKFIYWACPKLEFGKIATEYCYALEDFDNTVDIAEQMIEYQAELDEIVILNNLITE